MSEKSRELQGKTAIVTGAAAGIGRATALKLVANGADIVAVDRDLTGLEALVQAVQESGGRATSIAADLSELESADEIVGHAVEQPGELWALVNSAGINTPGTLVDTTAADFDRIYRVNLRAPFIVTQAVANRLVAQGRGGRVVNVSSSAAFRATDATPAYAASKGGLQALTRIAAGELGRFDINVNCVVPGLTRTEIARQIVGDDETLERSVREGPTANLLGRLSEPEDVANVIAFLCLRASRQITGQLIHTSAGAVV
ncbi:MAG: SDR family oxidoreductase [Nocardioides sp.]|uniref:SDR family NAD(P)-dependent oxidoreductase n=1 Tax=Nocardioides sp. TaxID=35761 RepID=UPI0039E64DBA